MSLCKNILKYTDGDLKVSCNLNKLTITFELLIRFEIPEIRCEGTETLLVENKTIKTHTFEAQNPEYKERTKTEEIIYNEEQHHLDSVVLDLKVPEGIENMEFERRQEHKVRILVVDFDQVNAAHIIGEISSFA